MTPRTAGGDRGTPTRILDIAEELVQNRGFNGFSYADIAAAMAITKPALYYHFPSKSELGIALVRRYEQRFFDALSTVSDRDAPAKLEHYAGLYAGVLRAQRMCLCGMLAAEYSTLSEPMQQAVIRFFERNEAWLGEVLIQGQREGTLAFAGSPPEKAHLIISCLEGAMLVARLHGDFERFQATATNLLSGLVV